MAVSAATFLVARRMPNVFTSETLVLVNPQKVPDTYVRATVTGDVRNRLGTLSQQILSATRLQRIIETLNLYPEERKTAAREDVISRMRGDISVNVISDYGASQDLQAFRISYRGAEPQLVAKVTQDLANLFIDENLKARTAQATGTSEFLTSQLGETLKNLEVQEGALKNFKMRHVGEMPEQQVATLSILGQLQSQLQIENEALNRAEQQKAYLQSMMVQVAPVVDLDDGKRAGPPPASVAASAGKAPVDPLRAELTRLEARGYTSSHPSIRQLKAQIAEQDAKAAAADAKEKAEAKAKAEEDAKAEAAIVAAAPVPEPEKSTPAPVTSYNPVLLSQLSNLDGEIAKHKEESQRLRTSMRGYQSRLEAIPVREQEMTKLVRDYETAKAHYTQLKESQMSAETATQLEINQKGERFEVLDYAQPAEKPTSPNRMLINGAGSLSGLLLGIFLAIGTEFLGMSITSADDVMAVTGLPVLEVIPVITTQMDRRIRRRRIFVAAGTAFVGSLAVGVALFMRSQG